MNLQEEMLKIKNEMIDEFNKRVEALKVDEQEFPQVGDDYWFINSTGSVINEKWGGLRFEKDRLEFGNVFQTKEQAEFAVEKLKVEAELRKFSRPFKEDENNYYIELHLFDKTLLMGVSENFQKQGVIYFESEEKTQQAVSTIGEERIKKYIFGVED